MNSGFRLLAALFALVAFSLSWAEGVWAASCSPGMQMESMAVIVASDTEMEMPATEHSGTESEGKNAPACPINDFAATGLCTGTFSLPVQIFDDLVPSVEGALLMIGLDQSQGRLITPGFFHPPRA